MLNWFVSGYLDTLSLKGHILPINEKSNRYFLFSFVRAICQLVHSLKLIQHCNLFVECIWLDLIKNKATRSRLLLYLLSTVMAASNLYICLSWSWYCLISFDKSRVDLM
jgi:hypothetical protein